MPAIRFEPLSLRWIDEVSTIVTDPDVLRFTRFPDPLPAGFTERWLRSYDAGRKDGTRKGFAALADGDEFVGVGLAPRIDLAAGELELGYIVAPPARGRGLATAILSELTAWAFRELDAKRIYLIIDVENAASGRVAERCGYLREGTMRSLHLKQGRRIDADLWSRLPGDPEPAGVQNAGTSR